MNLAAHIAVAARARPDASLDLLAGSALPDVASLGRVRLRTRPEAGTDLADGVDLHHRTDDLFHGHRWFTDLSSRVSSALRAAGVGRGPARAVGHVGVELLLDGRLLVDPGLGQRVGAALGSLAPPSGAVLDLVADEHRHRWHQALDWVAAHRPPPDHRPPAVAERLHRILGHRPRLALPEGQVTLVAGVLADHRAEIDDGAEALVAELADRLR